MSQLPPVDRSEDDLSTALQIAVRGDEEVLIAGLETEFDPIEAADMAFDALPLADGSMEYEYHSEASDELVQEPMYAGTFGTWTRTFFFAHIHAFAAAAAAVSAAAFAFGSWGIAFALPLGAALIGMAYYEAGAKLAKGRRDQAEAIWKPAFAGALLPSLLCAVAGLGAGMLGFAVLFPLCAHAGAHDF